MQILLVPEYQIQNLSAHRSACALHIFSNTSIFYQKNNTFFSTIFFYYFVKHFELDIEYSNASLRPVWQGYKMILADVKELAGFSGDYGRHLYLGYHRPRPTLDPAKLERFSYSQSNTQISYMKTYTYKYLCIIIQNLSISIRTCHLIISGRQQTSRTDITSIVVFAALTFW